MRGTCAAILIASAVTAAPAHAAGFATREALFPATLSPVLDTAPAAQTEPPPSARHTGVAALVRATAADFNAFPRRTSTWVILGLGVAGAALAYPADHALNAHLVGSPAVDRAFAAGKYLGSGYAQVGLAATLYLVGRYALPPDADTPWTNKTSHVGIDMVRALIVSQAFTQAIKVIGQRDRPMGGCCAFPSGHTSAAFATASVLERHFGSRRAWPALVIAAYVAASRLHDNQHFLSDVVFGAALGIASGWTVVGRHGRSDFSMRMVPVAGGVMVAWLHD